MQVAPRGQDLLIGIALLVIGGLLAANFRGFRGLAAWNARRANESATWTERLLGRVPAWKSLPRQPLDDRTRMQVIATLIGLALAAAGVVFCWPPSASATFTRTIAALLSRIAANHRGSGRPRISA